MSNKNEDFIYTTAHAINLKKMQNLPYLRNLWTAHEHNLRSSLLVQDWSIHQDLEEAVADRSGTLLSEKRMKCIINNLLYRGRRKISQGSTCHYISVSLLQGQLYLIYCLFLNVLSVAVVWNIFCRQWLCVAWHRSERNAVQSKIQYGEGKASSVLPLLSNVFSLELNTINGIEVTTCNS